MQLNENALYELAAPTRYEIYRDGKFVASFEYGDPSRFDKPFDDEVAQAELESCSRYWDTRLKRKCHWELRIHRCVLLHPPHSILIGD